MKSPIDSVYDSIDALDNPARFVASLEQQAQAPLFLAHRRHVFNAMSLEKGAQILEVGCGLGHHVRELATIVGSKGHVWGIDKSTFFIREAIKLTANLPITFDVADVYHLPFADDFFNAVYIERVLIHLTDPWMALREAKRVVQQDGMIAITEANVTQATLCPTDSAGIHRLLLNQMAHYTRHPTIGSLLLSRFQSVGLVDIQSFSFIYTITTWEEMTTVFDVETLLENMVHQFLATRDEVDAYCEQLKAASVRGEMRFDLPFVSVIGRKAEF